MLGRKHRPGLMWLAYWHQGFAAFEVLICRSITLSVLQEFQLAARGLPTNANTNVFEHGNYHLIIQK